MTLLILGLLLWAAAHYFKRIAPDARAKLGEPGKGLVAVVSIGAIVLMVLGYRASEDVPLWDLGPAAISANNLIMVVVVILFGVGQSKSRLRGRLRHPMLTGLLLWVVAHLMVNGDLSSVVLFGGLGLWAIGSMILINRAEPAPVPFVDGTLRGDVKLFAISVVVFIVIAALHTYLGRWPFPG